MKSKEAMNKIDLMIRYSDLTYDELKSYSKYKNQIEKDLEVLEYLKSKTQLFYIDRKKIAQEYEKWCKDNNAMITDTTNMITWALCFKLKEWLDND